MSSGFSSPSACIANTIVLQRIATVYRISDDTHYASMVAAWLLELNVLLRYFESITKLTYFWVKINQ